MTRDEIENMVRQAREFAVEYHDPELIHSLAAQVVQMGEALLQQPECGATCPSGPYAGVVCTLGIHRAEVEHEAWAHSLGSRRSEPLETWR